MSYPHAYNLFKYGKILNHSTSHEVLTNEKPSENSNFSSSDEESDNGNSKTEMKGHLEDSTDRVCDHDEEFAAKHLLEIKSNWESNLGKSLANLHSKLNQQTSQSIQLNSSDHMIPDPDQASHNGSKLELDYQSISKSEVSIIRFYEPRFHQVFTKYCESQSQPVDVSCHLMVSCLENLVNFSCWARENGSRAAWIKSTLEDNVDLRPEVRNGLSMILIYCLSTARAKLQPGEDMFTILQDPEMGLGIVNKTSLKVYNDPFSYFNFLKSCISGLIDAGKIPENERINQVSQLLRFELSNSVSPLLSIAQEVKENE